jgi:hypothetical protein
MNLLHRRATNGHRNQREVAMIEFADIFAYDLSSAVFTMGGIMLLTAAIFAVAMMNRVPTTVRAFDMAPAFGL